MDARYCAKQPFIEKKSLFPAELVGKKVLLATESLGPVNGVSRTTQSLVDYLRKHGVHVATCAPYYKGQPFNGTTTASRLGRQPIVNKDWIRAIQAKSSSLASRGIGGAWLWHSDRDGQSQPLMQSPQKYNPFNRQRMEETRSV
jgi:hypothetical protein